MSIGPVHTNSGLHSIKQLGVFYLLSGMDTSPYEGSPNIYLAGRSRDLV